MPRLPSALAWLPLLGFVACYPDFQFSSGGTGGISGSGGETIASSVMASSGASHPGTSSSKSVGASSSSMSSSSTGNPLTGPPCITSGNTCDVGSVCCFDTISTDDSCGTSASACAGSDLTLECTDDASCQGQSCCVRYDAIGDLLGTECRSDCSSITTTQACDPTNSPNCSCHDILDDYFQSGTASPPYDVYGECN